MKGDDQAVVGPIGALGDADGLVRHGARVSVVNIGRAAVPGLITALGSANGDMRWEAARALTEIRDPRAAPALVESLRDDQSGVRWLAAEALMNLGSASLDPLLHALLSHSDSIWLREGAHHVLTAAAGASRADLLRPVLQALEGVEPAIGVLPATATALTRLASARNARSGASRTRPEARAPRPDA